MEGLAVLLFLGSIVALVYGAVKFVRAGKQDPSRRRLARNWMLGAFAAFVLSLIVVPKRDPQSASAPADAAGGEKPTAAAATEAEEAAEQKKVLTNQTVALWQRVVNISAGCEAAARGVTKASATGDVYTMYPAVKAAEEACRNASMATERLDAPEAADGKIEDAFEDGIEKCARGQLAKQMAFAKLAEVLDGDSRPSAVTEAKRRIETASEAGLYCAAGIVGAASEAGLDISIFKQTDDQKSG
jgi:hypothetical protein